MNSNKLNKKYLYYISSYQNDMVDFGGLTIRRNYYDGVFVVKIRDTSGNVIVERCAIGDVIEIHSKLTMLSETSNRKYANIISNYEIFSIPENPERFLCWACNKDIEEVIKSNINPYSAIRYWIKSDANKFSKLDIINTLRNIFHMSDIDLTTLGLIY